MRYAYYRRNNSASRSFNAEIAEEEGRYSASKFKQIYGIDPRPLVTATEWHHVSKFANRVNYYDIEEVMNALAEMPYSERGKYIKKGSKFRAYWLQNRGDYLRKEDPATLWEQRRALKENQMYKVLYDDWGEATEIIVSEAASSRHIFHAVRKAQNEEERYLQKERQKRQPAKKEPKDFASFKIPFQYVTFKEGRPISARIVLNGFFEGLDELEPIYYELNVTGYEYRYSKRGGALYFTKK